MFCGKCGTEISDGVKYCPKCGAPIATTEDESQIRSEAPDEGVEQNVNTEMEHGAEISPNLGKSKRFIIFGVAAALVVLVVVMVAVFEVLGIHFKHEWTEATCTEPRTCIVGGETEGEALGHEWKEATCTVPKTCSVCGVTEGEALGHEWEEATCTAPKTCSVCGVTAGKAQGHEWEEATCTNPKTCSVCGETEGESLEHNINYNTGKCSVCGRQIIAMHEIDKSNLSDYFNVTYSKTSESPCTITVEPIKDGYKYYGSIIFKVYVGKSNKTAKAEWEKQANTYYTAIDVKLDENGYGSGAVTFDDYSNCIRLVVSEYFSLRCWKE